MSRYGRDDSPRNDSPRDDNSRNDNPQDREISFSSGSSSNADKTHPAPRLNGKAHDSTRNLEPELPVRPSREREETPLRDYEISESQVKAMVDIGAFRAVNLEDLTKARYGGDQGHALREINALLRQKLLRRSTSHPEGTIALTLTREGRRVLLAHKRPEADNGQVYYEGFVKPREAEHDAGIYRLYQKEAEKITESGGHITRVVLDFEIKKSLNRQLARLSSLPEGRRSERKAEIAKEHGLSVVKGKIQIPDLRVEYEDREHNSAKVDLELATGHYRRASLAAKSSAGFKIYASPADAARLRPAMGDPEIMQEIFSL